MENLREDAVSDCCGCNASNASIAGYLAPNFPRSAAPMDTVVRRAGASRPPRGSAVGLRGWIMSNGWPQAGLMVLKGNARQPKPHCPPDRQIEVFPHILRHTPLRKGTDAKGP